MKYKPRQSNFEEFSDEVVGRILEATATIEGVKDAIAREIDEYIDAIMKEHLEAASVFPAQTAPEPVICFSFGDDHQKDGKCDLFYRDVPLKEILDDLDFEEFEESTDAIRLAERFETLAQECRAQADCIIRDNLSTDEIVDRFIEVNQDTFKDTDTQAFIDKVRER